jgi:hypothetical protein
MKAFLFFLAVCLSFAVAEVFLKGFAVPPGKFDGEKSLYTYETLRAGKAVMRAEILSVPFSGTDPWGGMEKQGKILFRDGRAIGFKYQDKIILMKAVGEGRVLRLTLNPVELE